VNDCTLEKFRECVSASRVCTDGEVAVVSSTSCCPSCRRCERTCDVASVAKCHAAQPDCGTGEVPRVVDGECCPTCRITRPTCEPACGATSICVRSVTIDATTARVAPVCLTRSDIKFDITPTGAVLEVFRSLNADQIREVVAEYIRRYCDKAQNAERCAANADALASAVITVAVDCGTRKSQGGDERADSNAGGALVEGSVSDDSTVTATDGCKVRVLVSVGESTSAAESKSSMFRMFADSTTAASVVTGAVTSDSETQAEGLSATTSTTTVSTTGANGAASVKSEHAALVAIIAAALLA